MKTLGLIGGIGPESTIEYYRYIIACFRQQKPDAGYPAIVVNSVNLTQLIEWMNANELEKVVEYLVVEVERLAKAGADFGAFASNTPHIVFDQVQRQSRIPLISIVEATCERVQALAFKKVALFGTRFTMQGHFYPEVFSRAGVELVVPEREEQTYIHEKYLGELLNDIFLPETRLGLLAIADKIKARHGIEGLILGGTELPLILRDDEHNGTRLLDTTRIHCDRIVSEIIS
ncbi:MAG: amino acid racemase [Pyrinomonadaceae bacterium]|nr:amino acid racemase [Pyrinomonadaceae bacterium]